MMFFYGMFWSSVFFVLYAYVGYPLALMIISLFFPVSVKKAPYTSPVTVIISVYNEEKVVAEKIENSLALDYPKEQLEIMVVSDASSDRTEEIARGYSSAGVKVMRVEGRVGKTACLNRAVLEAKGEIIIFSDANSVYDKRAVREIVSNFADKRVGCVTGYTRYFSGTANTVDESVGLYARMERLTKRMETMVGSCVGADGAIFAIRKELYQPLKSTDINDFVIPLQIVRQGFRTILEERAWCQEETAKDSKGEFSRQVRITNRTLRAIFNNRDLLNFSTHRLFSFEVFSHKISKFLVPMLLIIAFMSNITLIFKGKLFYKFLLATQISFYGLSALRDNKSYRFLSALISACRTFTVVNLAILKGWITYFKGDDFTIWKTNR